MSLCVITWQEINKAGGPETFFKYYMFGLTTKYFFIIVSYSYIPGYHSSAPEHKRSEAITVLTCSHTDIRIHSMHTSILTSTPLQKHISRH